MDSLDISVLVCTRNRATSLRETLECLARNQRGDLRVEVVVIDNASQDETVSVAGSFNGRLPVRCLRESKLGKGHCLNRALDEGGLGAIVAVLDDDMSPHVDWFQGVAALAGRWPDWDIFAGNSYVIWPTEDVPGWAKQGELQGWAYSVIDYGERDKPLQDGRFPSGNHFWFRSSVVSRGLRFEDSWVAEAKFVLDARARGHKIMVGPDAITGHRIQTALLDEEVILRRGALVGRTFADMRLRPFREQVKQAVLFRRHPMIGRLYCLLNLLCWGCGFLGMKLRWSRDARFLASVRVTERLAYYRELLRVAGVVEEYRLFKRRSERRAG